MRIQTAAIKLEPNQAQILHEERLDKLRMTC